MLNLSRRPKETLVLRHQNADGTYDDTHVTIYKVEGQQVRLLIDADQNTNVIRKEIDTNSFQRRKRKTVLDKC